MLQVLVFIHIIAAITWLGGMLFLAMVMVPLARRDAGVAFGSLRAAAEKFVPIAWAAKVVLAGSGAYLAWTYWEVRPETFFTGETHFLQYLQMKTGIFIIVVVLSLLHDFWLGPSDDGPARCGTVIRITATDWPWPPTKCTVGGTSGTVNAAAGYWRLCRYQPHLWGGDDPLLGPGVHTLGSLLRHHLAGRDAVRWRW